MKRRRVAVLLWLVLAVGAGPPPSAAVAAEAAPILATGVELRAEGAIAPEREIESLLQVRPGEPLDLEAVRRTLRNLHAAGVAAEAAAYLEPAEGGYRVVFAIRKPLEVRQVEIEGDLCLRDQTMRRELPQREGDALLESRVVRGVYALLDLHREQGYLEASVRVGVEPDADGGLRVVYRVECGLPASVGSVDFEGELAPFTPQELRSELRSEPGSRYRELTARRDSERLEEWLLGREFRLARVERPETRYEPASRTMDLVFQLEVGPRFEVTLTGADARELRKAKLTPLSGTERFDDALLLRAIARLRRHYQERGHFKVEIATTENRTEEVYELGIDIIPGPVFEIESVELTGNLQIGADRLRELMATAPRRLLVPSGGRLIDEVLDDDVDAIRSFYALRGFSRARVGPPVIEERGERLTVRIPIEEGPQQRVVNLTVEGAAALDDEVLRSRLRLRAGGPFHPRLLEQSLEDLRLQYEELGFERTQVDAQQSWNDEATLVDIELRVWEGPRTLIDRVIVRGQRRTRTGVIRRALDLEAGEPLNPRSLLENQRNLYALGIFSRVEVEPTATTPFSPRRDVLVRVEEGRSRRVSYGIGFDSEGGVRGLLGYSHANLLGRALQGRVDLRASSRETQFRTLLRQPFLGRFRVPVTYSLFVIDETQESFDSLRRGAQVELEKPGRLVTLRALFTRKLVEVDNADPALQDFQIDRNLREVDITSVTPSLLIDRRDDPLTPTRGWSTILQTEYAFAALGGEAEFVKAFGQQTGYLGLGPFGVLAASARLGAIEGTGSASSPFATGPFSNPVPISERFFAGGRTTHRAYRRDELGIPGSSLLRVVEENGVVRLVPVGGNGLVALNLDYRFPIAGPFGGTVFVDSGNVWGDWRDVAWSDLKTGAGIGFRYLSPIGPLRLEVGWKLDREPGEDPVAWFVSFGYPF